MHYHASQILEKIRKGPNPWNPVLFPHPTRFKPVFTGTGSPITSPGKGLLKTSMP